MHRPFPRGVWVRLNGRKVHTDWDILLCCLLIRILSVWLKRTCCSCWTRSCWVLVVTYNVMWCMCTCKVTLYLWLNSWGICFKEKLCSTRDPCFPNHGCLEACEKEKGYVWMCDLGQDAMLFMVLIIYCLYSPSILTGISLAFHIILIWFKLLCSYINCMQLNFPKA